MPEKEVDKNLCYIVACIMQKLIIEIIYIVENKHAKLKYNVCLQNIA